MQAADLLLEYTRPSAVLQKRDADRVNKLAAMVRGYLLGRARRFVRASSGHALLFQYSSDCTPLSMRRRYHAQVDGYDVRRSGRATDECLVQIGFLTDVSGRCAVVLDRPLLMQDKTAITHWAAAAAFFENPRLDGGHDDILVLHHVYDRALMTSLRRLHEQHLSLQLDQHQENLQDDGLAHLHELTTWQTCVGCCCHDIHGGLRWSVHSYVKDRSLMKSTFISIESLRNGFNLLVKNVGAWLRRVLRFADWEPEFDGRALYELLGLDGVWLEQMAQAQMRFANGFLFVSEAMQRRDDHLQVVTALLLKVWGFQRWSDSRWAGLGRSCRCLTLAIVCGIESLVSFIRQEPGNSDYFISGFSVHATMSVKKLAAIVSMSGHGCDQVPGQYTILSCVYEIQVPHVYGIVLVPSGRLAPRATE